MMWSKGRTNFGIQQENGNCVTDINMEDYTITIQHLQTGETISESGALTSLIVGSLGPILIAFFIMLYAIKKNKNKKSIEEKK